MAYIIPNATETGSGQKYANINQAEPDSVDIEVLGNRSNWVRSGCEVSIASEQFTVTAGVVVVNNTPYSLAAVTVGVPIARASIGARTDLVVARLSGSSVSVEVLTGIDTATNPIFPKSKSVVTSFSSAYNYDPDNDVLLASIYVTASETTGANLVDKRIVNAAPTVRTAASAPASTAADVLGDVVIVGGIMYVKTGVSTWEAIATRAYTDSASFPVGSVFAWAGQTGQTPGVNYLECNGQQVLQSAYPSLFTAIGTIYGSADPGYFRVPNLSDDRTIIGSASGYGTSTGANEVSLVQANFPNHVHGISISNHTELEHSGIQVSTASAHVHATQEHNHIGALIYRQSDNGYNIHNNSTGYSVDVIGVYEGNANPFTTPAPFNQEEADGVNRFEMNSDPPTLSGGAHTHGVTIGRHSISSHVASIGSWGAGTTPTPVSTLSKSIKMRWYIRAL